MLAHLNELFRLLEKKECWKITMSHVIEVLGWKEHHIPRIIYISMQVFQLFDKRAEIKFEFVQRFLHTDCFMVRTLCFDQIHRFHEAINKELYSHYSLLCGNQLKRIEKFANASPRKNDKRTKQRWVGKISAKAQCLFVRGFERLEPGRRAVRGEKLIVEWRSARAISFSLNLKQSG